MVVFSHGGSNAVGIEVAKESRSRGLKVVAVTSVHGKRLADEADVVIDNCVPREDALVNVKGWYAPVAAGSTIATVTIAQAIVAEVAAALSKRGIQQPVFVSPKFQLTLLPPSTPPTVSLMVLPREASEGRSTRHRPGARPGVPRRPPTRPCRRGA